MHQLTKGYKLLELTSDRVPQAAKLLAKSFIRQNKVWSGMDFKPQKVQKYMTDKTLEIIDWQNQLREDGVIGRTTFLNFIQVDQKDKIVFVSVNAELMQYLTRKSEFMLEQFNGFAQSFEQLERKIDQRDKEQGLCVFNLFVAAEQYESLMGFEIMLLFATEISRYMHAQGFRKMYTRSTSLKLYSFIKRNGGQLKSMLKIFHNNRELTMSLLKISFQPFKYEYSLSAMATFNAKL